MSTPATTASHGPQRPDDRGVATIFLIVAMTVIFIGAGFAIDVGRYVFEARSAQNSADATALAVAADCAYHGAPTADYGPYRKTGQAITSPSCAGGESACQGCGRGLGREVLIEIRYRYVLVVAGWRNEAAGLGVERSWGFMIIEIEQLAKCVRIVTTSD